jgi:hypothetical protein
MENSIPLSNYFCCTITGTRKPPTYVKSGGDDYNNNKIHTSNRSIVMNENMFSR